MFQISIDHEMVGSFLVYRVLFEFDFVNKVMFYGKVLSLLLSFFICIEINLNMI